MKLRFLSTICLLLLLVQIVPVKQIAQFFQDRLADTEMSTPANWPDEEQSHTDENPKQLAASIDLNIHDWTQNKSTGFHFSTNLPPVHHAEIHSPPPNLG